MRRQAEWTPDYSLALPEGAPELRRWTYNRMKYRSGKHSGSIDRPTSAELLTGGLFIGLLIAGVVDPASAQDYVQDHVAPGSGTPTHLEVMKQAQPEFACRFTGSFTDVGNVGAADRQRRQQRLAIDEYLAVLASLARETDINNDGKISRVENILGDSPFAFQAIDADQDDAITPDEIKRHIDRRVRVSVMAWLLEIDTNQDAALQKSEIMASKNGAPTHLGPLGQTGNAFNAIDVNDSGGLSAKEVYQALRQSLRQSLKGRS